jgi:hypothetical protein
MSDATRVKVNTPGPARDQQRLVLRDKPRDAPSMEGWRIEVDYYLTDYRAGERFEVTRANGENATLTVHDFILTPVATPGEDVDATSAAADPLFETIYVSRELTGDEPDTLRRLMAEEVARERSSRATLTIDGKAIPGVTQISITVPESARHGLGFWSEAARKEMARDPARVPVGVCTEVSEDSDGIRTVRYGAATLKALGELSDHWRAPIVTTEDLDPKPGSYPSALVHQYLHGLDQRAIGTPPRHGKALMPPDPYESLRQSLRADWDAQRKQAEVKSFAVSQAPVSDEAKQKAKAAMVEALDAVAANPNCVTFAVYDGLRHWSCPKCKRMWADSLTESVAFNCACGFERPDAAAPRVPKVGDEIEVRWGSLQWARVGVTAVDGRGFRWERGADNGWLNNEGDPQWRWPEAKREARSYMPAIGEKVNVRIAGTWYAALVTKLAPEYGVMGEFDVELPSGIGVAPDWFRVSDRGATWKLPSDPS